MAQKKVGFSNTSYVQGDKLIINNGLTASINFEFLGATGLSFRLPQADGSSGWAIVTDGAGNLSFGTVSGAGNVQGTGTTPKLAYWTGTSSLGSSLLEEGSGQLLFPAGTLLNPGISFLLDQNTGFRRSASDEVSIVGGGSDIATFNSTGALIGSVKYTSSDGLAGYVLSTDGAGNTQWVENIIGATGPTGPTGSDGKDPYFFAQLTSGSTWLADPSYLNISPPFLLTLTVSVAPSPGVTYSQYQFFSGNSFVLEDLTFGTRIYGTIETYATTGPNAGRLTLYPRVLDGAQGTFSGGYFGLNGLPGNAPSGTSGTSGADGTSGTSATSGTSGTSAIDGTSGTSGQNGLNGSSGTSGANGTSGTSGLNGTSGTSATSGTSGTSAVNGTSGTSGINGTSGTSGVKGATGSLDAAFIDGWLDTGSYSTQIIALTNSTNWTAGNTFSGTITDTYQGQRYFNHPYIYDAVGDNYWVRYLTNGTSGTSGLNGTSGVTGPTGASGFNTTVSGTTNYVAKFTGATAIGNSTIIDNGTIAQIPSYSQLVVSNTSVTGTFTQSLTSSNTYAYTLTGNTTFDYSNPTMSVYNFMIKAGTYSFTLNSGSNWQTVGATALGFTGSFVMSAIYDGTDMWIATTKNYQSF